MVRIVVAGVGILLALLCLAMSFDSVDWLSESDGGDDGESNLVVARHNEIPSSFAAVTELSSDERPDEGEPPSASSNPPGDRKRKGSRKEKREASANRVKDKLAAESSLKSLLLKACGDRCKRRCLEKFKGQQKFQELLEFRKEWVNLHKTDQDVLLFDHLREILEDTASEGVPGRWKILDTPVCLKAYKRLHAAGQRQPPVDLRYLKSDATCKDQSGDSVRARVITFLEQVYNSQAETLPDTRDDAADESLGVFVRDYTLEEDAKDLVEDPYADALVSPEQSRAATPKSIRINPDRLEEEERYLPPGTMRDVWEQMNATDPDQSVSFAQFWRVWKAEYSHMKFRATSSHALCSICLRHKLLIREMSHHLKARNAQRSLFNLHLQRQYADRCEYWRLRSGSRLRSVEVCMIVDSMDQAKFAYPRSDVFRSKDLATLQRPRAHITGIICHGHFVLFSVSSQDFPKDSTTMIELIAHALTLLQKRGVNLRTAP
eukprot:s1526_g6.t1